MEQLHSHHILMDHPHKMHDADLDRLIEIIIEEKVKRRNHKGDMNLAKSQSFDCQECGAKAEDQYDADEGQPHCQECGTPTGKGGEPLKKDDQPDQPKKISTSYKLLTPMEANAKTSKNAITGDHFSAILHLAPATLAGCGNMCPAASEGCRKACLNTAGRGGMIKEGDSTNTVQDARIRKTKLLHENSDEFFKHLHNDINKVRKYSQTANKKPVVRLNGTSDLAWEDFRPSIWAGKNVFEAFPDVQFYDYTKRPDRVMKNKHGNYHLTFSQSEANPRVAKRLAEAGHNVAVVFGGKNLPKTYHGRPVISGDEHDLRFLDPKGGNIVGLKAKGDAKADTSGFVVWNHEGNTLKEGPKNIARHKIDRIINATKKKQEG